MVPVELCNPTAAFGRKDEESGGKGSAAAGVNCTAAACDGMSMCAELTIEFVTSPSKSKSSKQF